ncbi:MAG: gamma-glutamyltransferase family protein [Variovorax sp.]|nr:gamma-glutamyltransferase family protein [Variovorax sp.]
MAATAHPQATLLAIDILREGGSAADAGIAAMALLCVIEPQATGIGGDCFAVYAPGGRSPVGLNGSGRSPALATPEALGAQGVSRIDALSAHAVTVPGAVDAWCALHARYGRLPFERLLAPAIHAAREGYIVHDRVARDWALYVPRLKADRVSRETLLVDGRAPVAGSRHRQPALARTLEHIAAKGRAGFYEGPIAEGLVARLNELGGLHTPGDFAQTRADLVDVIWTEYRGLRVCEIPPNTQGVTALMMLNVLSEFALGPEVAEHHRLHLLAEATKAAYRRRDALIGDPAFAGKYVERLLSPQETQRMRAEIDAHRAGAFGPLPEVQHRDTTYLCVVDRDGNALSLINSLFEAFGTGISSESGVIFQNRGASFNLQPGHPNVLAPRKRPMHTIIPAMLCKGDEAVMPFGVMGGHYQAAGHAALVSNILDLGLNVQEALARPRSFASEGRLLVEPGIEESVCAALIAKGHVLDMRPSPIGGGQAIWIDRASGQFVGGSDPRKDGMALGY